jgi:hypothetical protein
MFSGLDGYRAMANSHQRFHFNGRESIAAFLAADLPRGMERVAKMKAVGITAPAGEGDNRLQRRSLF